MAGKGRLQGGCSGGARPGTGPKKRKPGLTRTQKRLAKQAALAHAVDETGEAQHTAPAPATVPGACCRGGRQAQHTGQVLEGADVLRERGIGADVLREREG